MLLSLEIREKVLCELGYFESSYPDLETKLGRDFSVGAITKIEQILADLAQTDLLLESAKCDSMAVKVDTLSVSYKSHVSHLISEGSRNLMLLANIICIPIKYNRYTCTDKNVIMSNFSNSFIDYR